MTEGRPGSSERLWGAWTGRIWGPTPGREFGENTLKTEKRILGEEKIWALTGKKREFEELALGIQEPALGRIWGDCPGERKGH